MAEQAQSTPPSTNIYTQPRITIQYCTQCKWMLRAAYFAQELLSTFSTDIGEVALIPRTGGVFTVTIFPNPISASASSDEGKEGKILWDRKADGGFPEVKELKSRVRNIIDPSRDLGHTDRALKKGSEKGSASAPAPDSTSPDAAAPAATSTATPTQKPLTESTIKAPGTGSGPGVCEDCQ